MEPDFLAEQLALNQIEAYGGGCVVALIRLAKLLNIPSVRVLKKINSGDITSDKLKVEGYLAACL